MTQPTNTTPVLDSAEAKRALIYGALMLYGAETIPLRERALDQAVLAALIGSSLKAPLKNGDIQRRLRTGIGNIDLRPELISATVRRLNQSGLISIIEEKKKPAYYLTDSGEEVIQESAGKAECLFEPVLAEILNHSDESLDKSQAASVLRDFISSAFSRLGSSIAAYLLGRHIHLSTASELAVIFDEAAVLHGVPSASRESLKARCLGIFKSKSLAARRLMFHLTQGYCFAQLLGIDRNGFNPITAEAFKDSVFYFDTNVLLAGLLPGDKGVAFAEILGIAKRIGVELRVTRATIDETRFTTAEKLAVLEKIAELVPEEVGELSSDEFVAHFFDARREKPTLTPGEFLADFESIADVAQNKWGLVIEEETEDSLLAGHDTAQLAEVIQAASVAWRGYKKNEHVLRHDLAHIILIETTRKSTPKAWFLTRDRALINAAGDLSRLVHDSERPFCFGMLGFLQSISPFVSSIAEDDSLSSFFSALLTEQVFISEKLFDDRELALMAETHADVMAMPPDQVVIAVDYVKKQILKGEQYRVEKIPTVALELRKFLSATNEEKQRALESRAAGIAAEYQAIREAMIKERALRSDYENKLRDAEDTLAKERSASAVQQDQIEEFHIADLRRNRRRQKILQAVLVLLVIAPALLLGRYSDRISAATAAYFGKDATFKAGCDLLLRMVKYGLLLAPCIFFIQRLKWSTAVKNGATALIVIAWFCLGGVQHSEQIGTLSNLATDALFLCLFIQNGRNDS
jgi:DNA-binding PadR family transcriptional regulator